MGDLEPIRLTGKRRELEDRYCPKCGHRGVVFVGCALRSTCYYCGHYGYASSWLSEPRREEVQP